VQTWRFFLPISDALTWQNRNQMTKLTRVIEVMDKCHIVTVVTQVTPRKSVQFLNAKYHH
jgi:hypothetical protein